MRTFTQLRSMLATHADLKSKRRWRKKWLKLVILGNNVRNFFVIRKYSHTIHNVDLLQSVRYHDNKYRKNRMESFNILE